MASKWRPIPCPTCGVYVTWDNVKCWNCGELQEEEHDLFFDILGGEKMDGEKYQEFKGMLWKTPYGIGIKIFINKDMLDSVLEGGIKQWNKEV